MNDVDKWLRNLGLEQYAEAFSAQEIDFGILPQLSDADLKEIGVAALGHRKRLIQAIVSLNDQASGMAANRAPPAARDAIREPIPATVQIPGGRVPAFSAHPSATSFTAASEVTSNRDSTVLSVPFTKQDRKSVV